MSQKARLLLVDDDPPLLQLLTQLFIDAGYETEGVGTVKDGVAAVGRQAFDVALIDLNLPDGTGLDLLTQLRTLRPELSVILLTAASSVEAAVEAMRRGADNFVVKPVDPPELLAVVGKGIEACALRRRSLHLDRLSETPVARVLGQSAAMKHALQLAERVAPHDTTVLLLGPTGSGKGLLARTIHDASQRRKAPFVALNSAALSKEMVESELFGHERGAFTGANERKLGLLEAAEGGTLFLDEIAELDISVQAKLLTALEERRFRRLGGLVEIAADVRLVAATHRDLPKLVSDSLFRADLYHRLNVFAIALPPLCDRDEDILPLAVHFLRMYRDVPDAARALTDEAAGILLDYDWPGNVRELRNVMERAAILAPPDAPVDVMHLPPLETRTKPEPPPPREPVASTEPLPATLEEAERMFLERALRERKGSLRAAAKDLGISRGTLYRKARKYNLPLED